jgi:beta-galactosidase
MMQRAGVNAVRMGEFAWSALEPEEGRYDFAWMDRAVALLHDHGIKTLMCTCSRTPPPWAFVRYPGIANVSLDGKTMNYGERYTVGLAHPEFVELSQRIDEAVIEHFAGHPAVIGWQIDNEVGGGNDCYCPRCLALFRDYLREKYGTIEALNAAWGENFWSFRFTSFDEVPLPGGNPQLALAYRRFMSRTNVQFARWRYRKMKEHDPEKWVTTNFKSFGAKNTDYFALQTAIDINGMNHYPARSPEFILDYYRGDRGEALVLEQCTRLGTVDIGDGWMRLWAWMAIAHGATGINFFRWRSARWGQEQHADGILPHAGQENRRYRELVRMGQEIPKVAEVIDATTPRAQVAVVMSYESRWAMDAGVQTADSMDGAIEAIAFHEALIERNVTVDAMDPRGDLDAYRLVIAPRLFLADDAIVENLLQFVVRGGTLCLTAGSGVVDRFNKSFDSPRPGPLREAAGIVIDEFSVLEAPVLILSAAVPGLDGAVGTVIADEIEPAGSEILATFGSGWRKGLPALTSHPWGNGRVLYLGTMVEGPGLQALVEYLCEIAEVESVDPGLTSTPENIRAYERQGSDRRLLFLLNFGEKTGSVTLSGKWQDAFTGETVTTAEVLPLDIRLLIGARRGSGRVET